MESVAVEKWTEVLGTLLKATGLLKGEKERHSLQWHIVIPEGRVVVVQVIELQGHEPVSWWDAVVI